MEGIKEVFTGFGSADIQKREEEFDRQAVELFSQYQTYQHFNPIFPNCLVRVLPKELAIKSEYLDLIIPDIKTNNKPVYEGVVLRTWKPKTIFDKRGNSRTVYSELAIGYHVLFPHYAGQPLPGLNEDRYRSIPEGISPRGLAIFGNDVGCIIAKLDYKRPRTMDIFHKIFSDLCLESVEEGVLDALEDNFDLVVKEKQSRTKSGV